MIVINTRPELREQALAEGADAFVCKGDPPEKLLATLKILGREEDETP